MRDAAASRPAATEVLWLIKGLGPGGAEALLVAAAEVLDRERLHVRAAYVRPDKDQLAGALERAGVDCQVLGGGPRGTWAWPLRLRSVLVAGDIDIVHVHSPAVAAVARVVVRTLPQRRRPAVVVTEHNEWPSFAAVTRWLNAVTSPLDDHRWAVSNQVRDSMWPAARATTEVLIHGIARGSRQPSPEARVRVRAELRVAKEAVVAIAIANLRREKDYPNLLRACRLAIDTLPDLYVLCVGQGPLVDEVQALHRELGLGDRVRLLGYRTDGPELLAASDLFVLGSAHEGLPVAMMEALSAGLPVVATAVGGLPDAIRTGVEGILVPPHDPAALAQALIRVATDSGLRALMSRAALEAARGYDIRSAVDRQSAVYEELSSRRRTAQAHHS